MTDPWPLRSSLELGALPTAVPCACLHVKHVLWEWGLNGLAESAELLVSELVSNAVNATGQPGQTVALSLAGNATGVLIEVRDSDPQPPKPTERTTTARARVPTACSWWRPSAPAGTGTSPRNPGQGRLVRTGRRPVRPADPASTAPASTDPASTDAGPASTVPANTAQATQQPALSRRVPRARPKPQPEPLRKAARRLAAIP